MVVTDTMNTPHPGEDIIVLAAVVGGFIFNMFQGLLEWLDKPPTNGSILFIAFMSIWFISAIVREKAHHIERKIDELRSSVGK